MGKRRVRKKAGKGLFYWFNPQRGWRLYHTTKNKETKDAHVKALEREGIKNRVTHEGDTWKIWTELPH